MTQLDSLPSLRRGIDPTSGVLLQSLISSILILFSSTSNLSADESDVEFFERHIRPALVKHCFECHSASSEKVKGGLRLDYRDGLREGGDSGPAVVPGKPADSVLLDAIRYETTEMPPAGKLPDHVIANFEKWIRNGAVDPRINAPSEKSALEESWKQQLTERQQWWSLQPPISSVPPEVSQQEWKLEPVDRFILSKLENAGLTPARPAAANILLRRLSFVLTGLPPAPHQVQSFVIRYQANPDLAINEVVDELLASPHFGERFARHWMDVVRYTDTYGYEWDIPAKGSWEYRDYLIRAFNDDIGFDQLIREQIAGDLLPQPRINHQQGLNESMIGPMFYHLGEHRHGSSLAFNGIHQEMIDNKIDAFSKTFLAMTVACARCHDHKLDAISQRDYYALAGIFMTPRWTARPIDAPGKHDQQITKLKELRQKITQRLADTWLSQRGPLQSASALRAWAIQNHEQLHASGPDQIAWPFHQLLKQLETLKANRFSASAANPSTILELEGDATFLARGPVPATDSYTVTFETDAGSASLLRLEALTHESLGSSGPGRTAHGNFVLSQIQVSVQPTEEDSSPRKVKLTSARADYSQPNYPVEAALNSSKTGWGVGLGGNVDRTAWFYFDKPVDLPQGGTWTVQLDFQLGSEHVLGRFRLGVGTESAMIDSPKPDSDANRIWQQLAYEWKETHAKRIAENARFDFLTNFAQPGLPRGWVPDGDGMLHGYVPAATPLVSLQGNQLIEKLLEPGYHTRALSPKLPGALRLPAPETFSRERVTLKLHGAEWAGRRDIPQNAFLNEGPFFFDPQASATWMGVAAPTLANGVTRVLTEISTASLNSNFPPRTGVARAGKTVLPDDDEGHDKLSWFSLTGIVSHNGGGGPVDPLDEFASLYDNAAPDGTHWDKLARWLSEPVERFASGKSTASDVKLLNWMLSRGLLANKFDDLPVIADAVREYRKIEKAISLPRSVNTMDERDVQPVNYRLNVRGDVYDEGPEIPRGFLEVFQRSHDIATGQGSRRLELAQYLSSLDNPQTARVYVNRVWQWVFGTGLVATPNDFGKLGDRPSHPELLDWLALRFKEDGWSTKKLIRQLVLSQTFRQSGSTSFSAKEIDPRNRLLHHYPTRRLEAEAIRDNLLCASGELDRTLFGRPINPPRSSEDAKKRLFSGPIDSYCRRSLYLEMSIMDPPKFLVGFNLPGVKLPTGRRDETNIPAQALTMLNDPFVRQQAERWAEKLLSDSSQGCDERIERMFITAFARLPDLHEINRWKSAITSFSRSDDIISDKQAWTELAHAMFNTKEFIYYR